MIDSGLIYVFTGDGKGKTSAALGVAIRALAAGLKVAIIQWYKDPSWRISDHEIGKLLNPDAQARFAIYPMGVGFYISKKSSLLPVFPSSNLKSAPLSNGQRVVDKATELEHQRAAHNALSLAETLIGQVDVLILDEINNALTDKLLTLNEVVNLISLHHQTHLILTGRDVNKKIIKLADLVTDMKKVKHPYDHGFLAVKGLDY